MNNTDLSHLGGFPLTQDRLDFLQQNYLQGFGALAKLCGDKVIVTGVEVSGGNVTDGWIVYNGELLKFIGGTVSTDVVINDVTTTYVYGDASSHVAEHTRTATCGPAGAFPFADLVPLLTLQNTWKKDDIRQCMKNAAYEAANFDGSGYGITPAEKGWRILSKVYTDAAGAVLVNKKDADTEFGVVGYFGGAKTHALTSAEQGAFDVAVKSDDGFGTTGGGYTGNVRTNFNGVEPALGAANAAAFGAALTVHLDNSAGAHNNLQPYFVVLTLIKL